jgi:hypothetical protein
MGNFLTAAEAKEKADNSEHAYKILRAAIYSNIERTANQGYYQVKADKSATHFLTSRLCEELKDKGYSVSYSRTTGLADTYTFSISWEYV